MKRAMPLVTVFDLNSFSTGQDMTNGLTQCPLYRNDGCFNVVFACAGFIDHVTRGNSCVIRHESALAVETLPRETVRHTSGAEPLAVQVHICT
eukprot:520409-Amphidinium_carterae.3